MHTQRIRSRLVEALEFRNVIQCERTRMMKKFDDMLSRYIIHSVRQMDGRAVAIVHAVILYGR